MKNFSLWNCKCSATMGFYFVVVLLFCLGAEQVSAQFVPITLTLDNRNWRLPENDPVGSRVARVRLSAESKGVNVTFGLEASEHGPGGQNSLDFTKLFRIDQKTGFIYLNESLVGKKGQSGQVSVVATPVHDDEDDFSPRLSTKIDAHIQIVGEDEEDNHFQPPFGRPQPSYNNFPGLPQNPQFSLPPGFPQRPNNPTFDYPNISTSKSTPIPSTTTISSTNPNTIANTKTTNTSEENSSAIITSTSTSISTTTSETSELSNEIVPPKRNSSENNHISNEETIVSNEISSTTIIPVAFFVILLLVVVVWLVYQKTVKNKSENSKRRRPVKEIRKGSSLSTTNTALSSGSRGDEDEPRTTFTSALQQWIGKRAESNRYEDSCGPQIAYDGDVCTDPNVPQRVEDPWEFPRHQLKIVGILGEGCFGQVWRCEALNLIEAGTKTVAVKTLKESAGERERADLLSELAVMKMLDAHPNVVRLLGCCTDKDPLFVIMEYVGLGKLQSFLRNSRAEHYYGNLHSDSGSLSSKDLTSFAYQVARGMDYLAGKGIIHRDLAARNVLIDKDRTCKVADFGFARDVVDNHVYERKSDGRLPIRWMAPEALFDNIFTTKTDVWSFGVLMWEIVTLGSTPYPGLGASEVMRKVRDGYRLEKPEHCRRELYNIMFYCWAHNPEDRPTFSDLVNFLGQLLFSETDYIELDRFPEHSYYNLQIVDDETTQNSESTPDEKL